MDNETRQRLADGAACLQAALTYLKLGWSVLPLCPPDHVGIGREHGKKCQQPGKVPWILWKDYQERLPSEPEVRAWWKEHPNSNVGVALGPVSGLIRVDIEGEAGEAALQAKSKGVIPQTVSFRSGRSDGTGRGLLYGIPDGVLLRTTYEKHGTKQELRFQAKGAETVLPPSRHSAGGLYGWFPGCSPAEIVVETAPDWLLAELAVPTGANGTSKPPRNSDEWETILQGVGEGSRNDTAAALAGKLLGGLRDIDDGSAISVQWHCFTLWNNQNDPPMSDDELKTTFTSILRKEKSRRERESSEILNRRIHQEIAVANEQKVNGNSGSEHNGSNGDTNGVVLPAQLPAWDLIELQGEPTSYLLRAPGWLDSPRLKDGYLPLSVDEILHWGGAQGIYRAAFARAGVVVAPKVRDWGSPGGGLEKLMETVKVVKRSNESNRSLYVLGYLYTYLVACKPAREDSDGQKSRNLGSTPLLIEEKWILFKLRSLKKRVRDDKEDFTHDEIMRALEENHFRDRKFQGTRWWEISTDHLTEIGNRCGEIAPIPSLQPNTSSSQDSPSSQQQGREGQIGQIRNQKCPDTTSSPDST